jgi:hypothetical protein
MITVSSNNQTLGVILEFMRHLLIGFVCGQTDMYTVYNKRGRKASRFPAMGFRGSYFLAGRYSWSRSIALSMFSVEFA